MDAECHLLFVPVHETLVRDTRLVHRALFPFLFGMLNNNGKNHPSILFIKFEH